MATLSQEELQSTVTAAFAALLKRTPGEARSFPTDDLKFTGTIHVISDGENVQFIKVHPFLQMLPPVAAAPRRALIEDIMANGQKRPIILHRGMILDGRVRYYALRALGLPVKSVILQRSVGDALKAVIKLNNRRLSDSQRTIVVRKAKELLKVDVLPWHLAHCGIAA